MIPNPWDAGTAWCLQNLGFRALATTSAGLAFSRALPDSPTALTREVVLRHVAELVGATDLPVNADFQSGYSPNAEGVADSVARCVDAGVAGLSIEDATGDPGRPLFELEEAVERIRAARGAIDASGAEIMLTARAECFLVGHDDPLRESIRRLTAYASAGADVLFAPGLQTRDEIRAVVDAVAPRPVNVLMSADRGLRVADLAELGVRRVSVGSAMARVAWGAFLRSAKTLAGDGSFADLTPAASFEELNTLFAAED